MTVLKGTSFKDCREMRRLEWALHHGTLKKSFGLQAGDLSPYKLKKSFGSRPGIYPRCKRCNIHGAF